jgi:SAM-dependent methyltransferase
LSSALRLAGRQLTDDGNVEITSRDLREREPKMGGDREQRRSMSRILPKYDAEQVRRLSDTTIAYYDRFAQAFWDGTRHHDVSQNYAAFLDAMEGDPPYSILDLGCGPGRDLSHFRSLGHEAVGLDGSQQFVAMARTHSQCEVFHQDFLAMQLPESRFDGIFANASLFHVPSQELPRVLLELFTTLKPRGVLFSSNPRGNNEEGLSNEETGIALDLDTWRDYATSAGFPSKVGRSVGISRGLPG